MNHRISKVPKFKFLAPLKNGVFREAQDRHTGQKVVKMRPLTGTEMDTWLQLSVIILKK